jgi:hypothetical protein
LGSKAFGAAVVHLGKISHFVRDDSSRISVSFRADARNLSQGTAQEIQTAPLPLALVSLPFHSFPF